ncbi:hypothetical protein V3595_21105 [Bacillus sp. CFBP9009]
MQLFEYYAPALMVFTVILTRLKNYATLLPNNWLAETPQALALMWQTAGGKGADF